MNKCLLISAFIFIYSIPKTFCQNLIPNSGFEDINICCEKGAPCSPEGWFGQAVFPYKQTFLPINPELYKGSQSKKSLFIDIGADANNQGYAAYCAFTPLLSPIIQNQAYTFTMDVLYRNSAVNQLHVFFSDTLFPNLTTSQPWLELQHPIKPFIKNRNKWVKLQVTFTAKSNARYLYVGVFKPAGLMKYKHKNYKSPAGYLIDNVSLTSNFGYIQPAQIDSARIKIYQENRRHSYSVACRNSGNIFPHLMSGRITDTSTTMPGILNKPSPYSYYANLESRNIIYGLQFYTEADADGDITLKNISQAQLGYLVSTLKGNPTYKVLLVGHLDESNKSINKYETSFMQARAVAKYLLSQGIDENRIEVEGKGADEMIAVSVNKTTAKLNNRIEFIWLSQPD